MNYRHDDVLALFERYLNSDKLHAFKKVSMMTFIATEAKKNDPAILQKFVDYSKQVVESNQHPLLIENYDELLILLSQKLKGNTEIERKHSNLVRETRRPFPGRRKKRKDFIAHDFYLKAISNYQKSGEQGKG